MHSGHDGAAIGLGSEDMIPRHLYGVLYTDTDLLSDLLYHLRISS